MFRRPFPARCLAAALSLLLGVSTCANAQSASSQPGKKPIRVGLISYGNGDRGEHLYQAFLQGMKEKGYVVGSNLFVERRYAYGHFDRVAGLARELAGLPHDAVLTTCSPSTRAMTAVPHAMPLVMAAVSDPVGQGLIKSYSHPGGTITGTASQFEELAPKLLGLLRELLPRATHVAVLLSPRNAVHARFMAEIEPLARSLGVRLSRHHVGREDAVEELFEGVRRSKPDAVLVLPDDPHMFNLRGRFVEQLEASRLPSVFGFKEAADDGGLMSYGESLAWSYRRAAHFLVAVGNGTRPADLPVERPTRFELVVNLKTARALGLTIPPSILIRADEVIE